MVIHLSQPRIGRIHKIDLYRRHGLQQEILDICFVPSLISKSVFFKTITVNNFGIEGVNGAIMELTYRLGSGEYGGCEFKIK
jgi:hypothetical protein